MSADVRLIGADLGSIESHAEMDGNGHIDLWLHDNLGDSAYALLSRAEAAKIMADLATAMGLIEAPKVAA